LKCEHYNRVCMKGLLVVCGAGYTLLLLLYRHSIRVIFNRQLPPLVTFHTLDEENKQNLVGVEFPFLKSFVVHLRMLRPLEVIYRFVTARFRVLPDVLVLGEVRCGTTSLCEQLSLLPGCHTPFSLWKHPELDHKETFYFVGHYLGFVNTRYWSMCFPLKVVRWFCKKVLRRPFFTFDGSAQYLTSPTAPYLIAKAYKEANLPPPVMIACVRDPVAQAASWWRYENNAIDWGDGMGLKEWNHDLRPESYPPKRIADAIRKEYSSQYDALYENDAYIKGLVNGAAASNFLPAHMMTWPGGQLSAIGRNGKYHHNITRYERAFVDVFGRRENNMNYVTIVPLEDLSSKWMLQSTLFDAFERAPAPHQLSGILSEPNIASVGSKVHLPHRSSSIVTADATDMCTVDGQSLSASSVEVSSLSSSQSQDGVAEDGSKVVQRNIHRNAGSAMLDTSKEPTEEDLELLCKYFADEVNLLEKMMGSVNYSWRRPVMDR